MLCWKGEFEMMQQLRHLFQYLLFLNSLETATEWLSQVMYTVTTGWDSESGGHFIWLPNFVTPFFLMLIMNTAYVNKKLTMEVKVKN